MHKHQTHKSESGFTLIELLIVIAIIGILTSVAIPQYSQYKIRGYDAQTKQALKNMHLLCNAYWLDTSALQGCDLQKIKEPTYGFNQNVDVVATLPPSPRDNFCASAKHNDSPNTLSIDSAALISSGSDCTGSSGTLQTSPTGGVVKTVSVREPLKREDWGCVMGSFEGITNRGPGTLINDPSSELHGSCVSIVINNEEKGPYGRKYLVSPPGTEWWKTLDTCGQEGKCFPDPEAHKLPGLSSEHSYNVDGRVTNRTLTAIHEYMANNELIVRDGSKMWSTPGVEYVNRKYYTVVSDGQGGLSKVDGSEEVTFEKWNTMSDDERATEIKKGE